MTIRRSGETHSSYVAFFFVNGLCLYSEYSLMAPRLSSTIFQSDSNTAVLVGDAYEIAQREERNSMYDSVKGIFGDAIDGLRTNTRSPRDLVSIIMDAKKGNINRSDMINRALGAMGTSLPNLLGKMGGTFKNKIGDMAGEMIGDNAKKAVEVIFDGIPLAMSTGSIEDTQDLFEFLSELTGNTELAKLLNIEAESAIISGIASMLMTYGIPELVDYVIEDSRSEQIKFNAWSYISIDAVNGSDLKSINKVIDMIGLAAFLKNNPDAINMILSQFYLGTYDTPNTWPAKRLELINTLKRIDPHWSEYNRNGRWIPNLEPFQKASQPARDLFFIAEPERTSCLAAIPFPPRAPVEIIKELYPEALVTGQ